MSSDPIRALIDAGAIPSSPFSSNSRYSGVAIGLHVPNANDPPVPYVLRRFIPQPQSSTLTARYTVQAGQRPDGIAAAALGDPELYYRIADENRVIDPFELTDTPGAKLAIPVPGGF
jgi:nucleoid-associated protein YgaU